ncbi:MAG: hypothetical protein VX642_14405 [Bdellovibrionota bacterium]|nr:hypothetical protein [Bdellovibrionota bacterium]
MIAKLLFISFFSYFYCVCAKASRCNTLLKIDEKQIQLSEIYSLEGDSRFSSTPLKFRQSAQELLQNELLSAKAKLEVSGASKQVKTVLYPFSGFDAQTPILLFPKSKNIIAVDEAPFVKNLDSFVEAGQFYHRSGRNENRYYLVGLSKQIPSVANAIVSLLASNIKNFRIIKVWAYSDKVNYEMKMGKKVYNIHGTILFDSGPGTEVRSYTHVQSLIRDFENPSYYWWFEKLKDYGLDAVVSKAALQGFVGYAPQLGREILKELEKNKGIFLDGEDGILVYKRLIPRDSLSQNKKATLYSFPWFTGGYAEGTMISFNPQIKGLETLNH